MYPQGRLAVLPPRTVVITRGVAPIETMLQSLALPAIGAPPGMESSNIFPQLVVAAGLTLAEIRTFTSSDLGKAFC
jgi:hypothetical protein